MLCKCHWIVLYTVHFTAFSLGGPFFPGHGVVYYTPLFDPTRITDIRLCEFNIWYLKADMNAEL